MKYFASFSANGGSTYSNEPYEYTNKKESIKSIKAIVKGNHFHQPCNRSKYMVWDENNIIVASGYLNDNGRWSINYDELGHNINEE